jgi:hypothetical protein
LCGRNTQKLLSLSQASNNQSLGVQLLFADAFSQQVLHSLIALKNMVERGSSKSGRAGDANALSCPSVLCQPDGVRSANQKRGIYF